MLCYCNETITLSNKFCRVKYKLKHDATSPGYWYRIEFYLHKVKSVECLRETEGPATLCYYKHQKNNLTTQHELFTTAPSLLPWSRYTILHHRFTSEFLQIHRHHGWDQGQTPNNAKTPDLSKSNDIYFKPQLFGSWVCTADSTTQGFPKFYIYIFYMWLCSAINTFFWIKSCVWL